MAIMRRALLWASRNQALARTVPRLRFAQAAVRRFMPGEVVESALGAAAEFQPAGITGVLTRLGENVTDPAEAEAVADHYLHVQELVGGRGLDAHISVKLTQLGLDLDPVAAREHVTRLVAHAAGLGAMVWVDMEGSEYVDRTLEVFRAVQDQHQNVGLCLQSYLYRTEKDLESLLPQTAAIRLVKGAYLEPVSVAFASKKDVDANYLKLARALLEGSRTVPGPRPAFATHDTRLIRRITATAEASSLPRTEYEFQMLYGIRSEEQARLAREGYHMRVLISYGEAWYPWYVRRLAERPANLTFVLKSLVIR